MAAKIDKVAATTANLRVPLKFDQTDSTLFNGVLPLPSHFTDAPQ